jgi:hypothetical protein
LPCLEQVRGKQAYIRHRCRRRSDRRRNRVADRDPERLGLAGLQQRGSGGGWDGKRLPRLKQAREEGLAAFFVNLKPYGVGRG